MFIILGWIFCGFTGLMGISMIISSGKHITIADAVGILFMFSIAIWIYFAIQKLLLGGLI